MSDSTDNPDLVSSIAVLHVEDDRRIGELTATYLEKHGLTVWLVECGDDAIAALDVFEPDVVLLDLMLGDESGYDVCRRLRERINVPIIMVSALDEENDRILGLEGGADDYVTKPFSPRELLARIRAQVRSAARRRGDTGGQLRIGPLVIDRVRHAVTLHDETLDLTGHEFKLLVALTERRGRVLSREALIRLVHDSDDAVFDRAIDVSISRLRQKLGDTPKAPRWIKTVRGVGYQLVDNPPTDDA